MLLHGLTASADLNWGPSYAALARQFRVVAPDLRGHGRGIPASIPFRLETCADDVAALADVLGIGRMVVVGYSMGGIVAQLVCRRHPRLVEGLVLCATASDFTISGLEYVTVCSAFVAIAFTRLVPPVFHSGFDLVGRFVVGPMDDPVRHWVGSHLRQASLATTVSAAHAVSAFTSRPWVGDLDVPVAVVVTTRDRVVPPARQLDLARAIPGVETFVVDEGHGVCLGRPDLFIPALLAACRSVASRR
jgi:pimeloyl-ACP methyl ester carboxylesterase